MNPSVALGDAEIDRLAELLDGMPSDEAMDIETVDGYFSALHCAPTMVSMGLVIDDVLGGTSDPSHGEVSAEAVSECIALLMQHWNAIGAGLAGSCVDDPDRFHMPLLFEDDAGVVRGNDWAAGFWRGMLRDYGAWKALIDDPEQGGAVLPVMALVHEHDPDPALRPEPIGDERRKTIVTLMGAGLHTAYRYFAEQRRQLVHEMRQGPRTIVRDEPKVGRNDACSCGSGRKYKRCHGIA
jgi:uncharacterized protein